MRHLSTLLLPIYQPVGHLGATPVQYPTRLTHAFETKARARTTLMVRSRAETIDADTQVGGGQIHRPVMLYLVAYDDRKALGEIVGLALETFSLDKVTVLTDSDASAEVWNEEDAANVAEGLD